MSKKNKIILGISMLILFTGTIIFGYFWYTGKINLGASADYSARFIKQEPKGTINLKQGEIKKIIVQIRNDGVKKWIKGGVYLELKNKNESDFYLPDVDFYQKIANSPNKTSGWQDPIRINFLEKEIKKGQVANFVFFIMGPFKEGNYNETYELMVNTGDKEVKISNLQISIKANVSKDVAQEKINKYSLIYKEMVKDLKKQGMTVKDIEKFINSKSQEPDRIQPTKEEEQVAASKEAQTINPKEAIKIMK